MNKLAMLAILTTSACGGLNYAMTHYSGVDIVHFSSGGKTYRVFDKPEEGRLMITPTLGDAAASGAIQGATFGLSGDPLGPQGEFRMAANAFVKSRDKSCAVTDGAKVISAQYEFFYTCGK